MSEEKVAYWNQEEPITAGSKGVQIRYFKQAGKLQINTKFEKQDGTVDRKNITLDAYTINKLKELLVNNVEG